MPQNKEIKTWGAFLRAVVFRPTWEFFTVSSVFVSLSVATWWRDNFASDEWKHKLDLKGLLAPIHTYWWVILGLLVELLLVVRVAHELYMQKVEEVAELKEKETEPLPSTAPQIRLQSDSEPSMGPIQNLQLINQSKTEPIYNIQFQPVQLQPGILVVWLPNGLDVLAAGERVVLTPSVLATVNGTASGEMKQTVGVESLYEAVRARTKASANYDIGDISFSCEDSVQHRYLVRLKVAVDVSGATLRVLDTERLRIGSRPSVHSTS